MNLQDKLTAESIEKATPKKELIELPFSEIRKDLTKLVNNKLYSNVTFLLQRNLDVNSNFNNQTSQEKYIKIYGHKVFFFFRYH